MSMVRSVVRLAVAIVAVSQLGQGIAAAQSADLAIEKWVFGVPGAPVAADAPFIYSISVFNNGPDGAQEVVVTDPLPPGVGFESADIFGPEGATCNFDAPSNTVTCALGGLPAFDGAFIDSSACVRQRPPEPSITPRPCLRPHRSRIQPTTARQCRRMWWFSTSRTCR